MRIERIAAGMADLNNAVLRYEPPVRTGRWPLWKLALNALGAATVFLLICVGLPAAWGG